MIVPQSRLLLWVTVIVLPFAVVAAVVPEAAVLAGLFIVAVVVLALLDAALAQGSLEGISIELPAVVRLSKDREGAIEVHITNEKQQAKRVRLGLPLPREIASPDEDLWTVLPAGSERSRLAWPCTPLKRGNYPLAGSAPTLLPAGAHRPRLLHPDPHRIFRAPGVTDKPNSGRNHSPHRAPAYPA